MYHVLFWYCNLEIQQENKQEAGVKNTVANLLVRDTASEILSLCTIKQI